MMTSATCRANADALIDRAEIDDKHAEWLLTKAEGWLFLAAQIRRINAFVDRSLPAK